MEAGFCKTSVISTKQNGVRAQKRVIFKTIITATFACVTTMNLLQPHKNSLQNLYRILLQARSFLVVCGCALAI